MVMAFAVVSTAFPPMTLPGHVNVCPPELSWTMKKLMRWPADKLLTVEDVTFPVRVILKWLEIPALKVGVAENVTVVTAALTRLLKVVVPVHVLFALS